MVFVIASGVVFDTLRHIDIMEDRYEIRGKIGQGGLGAVYRGYDTRMSREVAIKRISTSSSEPDLADESTRQLIKEAGALASFQHPHIVTVYDVGSDEDGPYVVMELISGKTLDELIERAPLTWPDFRELAMQTQEALIAAQEHNLIHSDLKPSNLMLTWLPSGKFQIKIVDFGLATLAQSQSKQDLETIEAVFGSIFFMPPEQFERTPLDARSDLYSMGCVYYQALTGIYPFDGTTGAEVMNSHLQHTVKPLKEVRSEIPVWVCDWIMWHINRYPQDRPESARESLSVFLKNDRIPNPPMSLGYPQPVAGPPRARLIIPGSSPQPAAQTGSGPATQALAKAKLVQTSQVTTLANERGTITQTAPQPLAPPEGFKPSVHTSLHELPEVQPTQGPATATKRPPPHQPVTAPKKPFKLGKNAKIAIGVAVALVLAIGGLVFMKSGKSKRDAQIVTELAAEAEKPGTSEIKVNSATIQLLLRSTINNESDSELQKIGRVLSLAKATDGTDVDERIAAFATKGPEISVRAKEILISEALRIRNNPSILPSMMDLLGSSDSSALKIAALQAIRQMADDRQFDTFLQIVERTTDNPVRLAAEQNIVEILRKSGDVEGLAKKLKLSQESSVKSEVQQSLQRLIGFSSSIKPAGR
jgi:serine/threonine protein kinase